MGSGRTGNMRAERMLLCVLTVGTLAAWASGHTPPSNAEQFASVLSRAKLQSPTAADVVFDVVGYASGEFELTEGGLMQFRMSGKARRTELRQMQADGDEVWFDVSGWERMRAVVGLPTPDAAMQSFTFLQTMCVRDGQHHQAAAVGYERTFGAHRDAVVASVAMSEDPASRQRTAVASRSAAPREFVVEVSDGRVSVRLDGATVVDAADLSFWRGSACYFKAGVYVHEPDDRRVFARTHFAALEWP